MTGRAANDINDQHHALVGVGVVGRAHALIALEFCLIGELARLAELNAGLALHCTKRSRGVAAAEECQGVPPSSSDEWAF